MIKYTKSGGTSRRRLQVLDSSYYHKNEFFRNNENALAIILYYDNLGITNPLGVCEGTKTIHILLDSCKYSPNCAINAKYNPIIRDC